METQIPWVIHGFLTLKIRSVSSLSVPFSSNEKRIFFFYGSWLELELGKALKTSLGKSGKGWQRAGDLCVFKSREAAPEEASSTDVPQGTISDWAWVGRKGGGSFSRPRLNKPCSVPSGDYN